MPSLIPNRRRSVMTAITNMFHTHSNSHHPSETSTSTTAGSSLHGGHILERSRSAQSHPGSQQQQQQAERDADLSRSGQDILFTYQLEQRPDPRRLGPECFYAAGVARNRQLSARVHAVLCKNNIISALPDDWRIYPDRITRQLPSQMPFLAPRELHAIVGLLFYWEQEQSRWNLLESQIKEEQDRFDGEMRVRGWGEVVRRASDGGGGTGAATVSTSAGGTAGAEGGSGMTAALSSSAPPSQTAMPESHTTSSATPTPISRQASQQGAPHDGESDEPAAESAAAEPSSPNESGYTDPPPGFYTPITLMASTMEQQALLERHKLAVAHLENLRRTVPSMRDALLTRTQSQDAHPTTNTTGTSSSSATTNNNNTLTAPALARSASLPPAPPAFSELAALEPLPPAYGDFHNSIAVMGSPSREDVSIIGELRRQQLLERDTQVNRTSSPGTSAAEQATETARANRILGGEKGEMIAAQ